MNRRIKHAKKWIAANNNIGFVCAFLYSFFHPQTNDKNFKQIRNFIATARVPFAILLFCSGVWAKIKSFPLDCMFAFESGMNTVMGLDLSSFFFRRSHSLFLLIDKISLEEEDTFNYNGHTSHPFFFHFVFVWVQKWIDKKHKLIRWDWGGSIDGHTLNMLNPELRYQPRIGFYYYASGNEI